MWRVSGKEEDKPSSTTNSRIFAPPPAALIFHLFTALMLFLSSVFFHTYYCYSCNYYIINLTILVMLYPLVTGSPPPP